MIRATLEQGGRQMSDEPLSTEDALQNWREAERSAALARRGRVAAEAAAMAAEQAATAANATAVAARSALDAMALAEASATKTAEAARLAALSTRADFADATSEVGMADVNESAAKKVYHDAVERAKRK
jgi:hypothetical protein